MTVKNRLTRVLLESTAVFGTMLSVAWLTLPTGFELKLEHAPNVVPHLTISMLCVVFASTLHRLHPASNEIQGSAITLASIVVDRFAIAICFFMKAYWEIVPMPQVKTRFLYLLSVIMIVSTLRVMYSLSVASLIAQRADSLIEVISRETH